MSMAVAGLGSALICGNMLGLLKPGEGLGGMETPDQEKIPPALRLADENKKNKMLTLHGRQVAGARLREAVELGQKWVEKNFQVKVTKYNNYYLYSLERYKSFEELLSGDAPEEPDWYQKGYERLVKTQKDHGGWHSKSGAPCSTAFAVLFLRCSFPPVTQPQGKVPWKRTLRDLQSPGTVLLALLVLFQSGNEWSIAGWLTIFLIRRIGISPALSLLLLALYWLALLLGRALTQFYLPRVSHTRLLATSIAAALIGCII
jgi:hypothetical protein